MNSVTSIFLMRYLVAYNSSGAQHPASEKLSLAISFVKARRAGFSAGFSTSITRRLILLYSGKSFGGSQEQSI
jgi:hypothetical protein